MVYDCPMTEDCPGYDRDRQACLIHPGDCEFSPAEDEAAHGDDASRTGSWCDCDDAPIYARAPTTFTSPTAQGLPRNQFAVSKSIAQ